jgi:hypothetical protein
MNMQYAVKVRNLDHGNDDETFVYLFPNKNEADKFAASTEDPWETYVYPVIEMTDANAAIADLEEMWKT